MQELLNKYRIKVDYNILLSMWNESHRGYHTQNHLLDLMNMINESKDKLSTKECDKLNLCAIFHDIIYDPKRRDNEERSAEFFLNCCEDKSNPDILQVNQMILDTKNHTSDNNLSKLFNKFDMNIVERGYDDLLEWENGIYHEFQFSGDRYKGVRLKFLESLLDKYPNNTENLSKLIDYVKTSY